MKTIDVMVWIFIVVIISVSFIAYILKPSRCPKCKSRMKFQCKSYNGKEVCSQECPSCGYEIILNEE